RPPRRLRPPGRLRPARRLRAAGLLWPWLWSWLRPLLGRWLLAWGLLASRVLRLGLPSVPGGPPCGVCDLLLGRNPVLLLQQRLLRLEPGPERLCRDGSTASGGSGGR